MLKMAKLLSEKKKYEALIKSDPSKRDEHQVKMDSLNDQAIEQLKLMEEYANNNKQRAVVAYA